MTLWLSLLGLVVGVAVCVAGFRWMFAHPRVSMRRNPGRAMAVIGGIFSLAAIVGIITAIRH